MNFTAKTAAAILLCLGAAACKSTVPLDVVSDGGEVCFVLEAPARISSVRVVPADPAAGGPALLWELRQDMTVPVERRKYPVLRHVCYGRNPGGFPVVTGPLELTPGTEYTVAMEAGDAFAQETFFVGKDGAAVMPRPGFKRQRGRVYSVSAGKDGARIFEFK